MRNTRILAVSLIIAVIAILGGVYFTLRHFQERALLQKADPFNLIPSDAFLLLHLKSPSVFLESVKEAGPLANNMSVMAAGKFGLSAITHIDSAIASNNSHYVVWQNAEVLISGHFKNENTQSEYLLQFVSTTNVRDYNLPRIILSTFEPKVPASSLQWLNHNIDAIQFGDSIAYMSIINNSLVMSSSVELIKNSIRSGNNGEGINNLAEISKLRNLTGLFADNLYLNTRSLCRLFSSNPRFYWPFVADCEAMLHWHAWDISYNAGHLLFNGFALPSTKKGDIASLVKHQTNIAPSLHHLIPAQTAVMFYMGLTDTEVFGQQIDNILNNTADAELMEARKIKFADATDLLPESIATLWKGELVWVLMKDTPLDEGIIILETDTTYPIKDHPNLAAFLREIKIPGQRGNENQKIFKSNIPGFIPLITHGFLTEDYDYITFIDNYMVAAKEINSLAAYINQIGLGSNFGEGSSFDLIEKKFPQSYNVKWHILPHYFGDNVQIEDSINKTGKKPNANNIGHIALQIITSNDSLFFSNLMIHQNETPTASRALWQTPLKAAIHKGPFKVYNHNDQSTEIVLQDIAHNLYLVDLEGNIKWSVPLSGPIMSDIFQVDIFKNNRYQYLFNTRNFLHLIDRNGRYVEGFPMRLPSPATAGIAVFDYDNNKDYRILFPSEDRRIYNYTLNRRPVTGWYYNKSAHIIESPLQHIRLDGRDYIFAIDNQGNLEILNRRGMPGINPSPRLKVNAAARVFAGTIADDPHFVVAGDRGELNLIRPNGSIEKFAPDTFSHHHQFVYSDIIPDREMEMVYLDDGILSLRNFSQRLLFSIPLSGNEKSHLSIVNLEDKGNLISVIDLERKLIFMVDITGRLVAPFPVSGNKAFFFDRNRDNNWTFVTGIDNMLVCYQIYF